MSAVHDTNSHVCVIAVVVTFHPDSSALVRQWTSLVTQVSAVVWVDNGGSTDLQTIAAHCGSPSPTVIAMGRNAGIGAAQNAGIACARRIGSTHILLMDQDSIPQPMMVAHLLAALTEFPEAAAAGPRYVDERNPVHRNPFVQICGLQTRRLPCADASRVWRVDHLIASGCLIPMWALDRVGPMQEEFFIDFVDVEWCLRARSGGNSVLGVCSASLFHHLGERHVRALGKMRHVHSPLRLYYQVRNALWLYRLPHVAANWKIVSAWRLFLKCAFYLICVQPRLSYFRQIIAGVSGGLFESHPCKRAKF